MRSTCTSKLFSKVFAVLLSLFMAVGFLPEYAAAYADATEANAEEAYGEDEEEAELVEAAELAQEDYEALVAALSEEPAEVAVVSIEAAWATADDAEDGDEATLSLVAEGDGELAAELALAIELSGEGALEVGALQVTLPASLFEDADGAALGDVSFMVPAAEDGSAAFAYVETEEGYVLVNVVALEVDAAAAIEIELSYSGIAFDSLLAGEDGVTCVSDALTAAVLVAGAEEAVESEALCVSVDLSALADEEETVEEADEEAVDEGATEEDAEDSSEEVESVETEADETEAEEVEDEEAVVAEEAAVEEESEDDEAVSDLQLATTTTTMNASTVASGTSGGCTWTLDSDGTLTISPTDGESGELAACTGSFEMEDDTIQGIESCTAPWYSYRTSIEKVSISSGVTAKSGAWLFAGCSNLTTFTGNGVSGFIDDDVTSLGCMFYGCTSLTSVPSNFKYWDTSSVESLWYTFGECTNLATVSALSGWDVSNVTDMAGLFHGTAITSVSALSGWDVSNVTDMGWMFAYCDKLSSVSSLSNWTTSALTDLECSFIGCDALTTVSDLNSWDVEHVTTVKNMFNNCDALTTADLSNWKTTSLTDMHGTFAYCPLLTTLDLSGWNTSKVTDRENMFLGDSSLCSITLGSDWTWGSDYTTVDTGSLPTPPSSTTTGCWICYSADNPSTSSSFTDTGYTPANLAKSWTSKAAGTWVWEECYTVKYNSNGGSGTMSNSTFTMDLYETLTSNSFTRTGYTFAGWNTKADGSGTSYSDKASVKNLTSTDGGTVTLYAQWEANTYTVKFNSNGGSGSMSSMSMTYGTSSTLTANSYSLTGYTFAGWNTKADGSGTSYSDKASVKNLTSTDGGTVTLYAQWEANTYTIVFDSNGGSGTMSSMSMTYDEAANLTANAFELDCYTFMDWNTSADGSGTAYLDEEEVLNLVSEADGTITLYAQWEADVVLPESGAQNSAPTLLAAGVGVLAASCVALVARNRRGAVKGAHAR